MANFNNWPLDKKLKPLVVIVLVSPFIPYIEEIWWFGEGWSGEDTRSIVLTLGAIGAFYEPDFGCT